jgi:glycosyltransferase involved in cell wall biosynthesis
MLNIVFVTGWNFMQRRGGDQNRVLGLVNAVSKMAKGIVLHQGPDMNINGARFLHYDPLLKMKKYESLVTNLINYYASPLAVSLSHSIQNILSCEDMDVVQVEQCFPFFPAFRARNSSNRSCILSLDNHNVHFSLPKLTFKNDFLYSAYRVASSPYIRSIESCAVRKSDIVLSVSHREAKLLKDLYDLENDTVRVVPNGVDIDSFEASHAREWQGIEGDVIFFHGSLSWYPNMEAASFIFDYIAPRMKNCTFIICGPNPTPALLKKTAESKNVKYMGYVDQLPKYIKGSDVCIAPLISGGGTKLKVLEYAAAGKPIVATNKAVEGLPFVNNYNALLYDKVDDAFIDGIKRVLRDEKLRSKISFNAKKTAQKYDWNKIASHLLEIYEDMLRNKKSVEASQKH